jgi:hypothetical protein
MRTFVVLLIVASALAGCEGSVRGNALQFREARDAYMACAKANGAAACQAERDVMNAAAIR